MIDQHLVELQLLNSAVVVDRRMMNGGNSTGAMDKKKVTGKKKQQRRRGLSDIDLLSQSKLRRRPSDIDSLSPEVLKALQATFGGKLDEIRSKVQAPRPSPPSAPSSPPQSPPRPPPLLPTKAVKAVAEERTFVERLADREGAHILVSYFAAIFLSGFLLSAAGEDDDGGIIGGQPESYGGWADGSCARLFGYILPSGLSAIFFTFALVLFVVDTSFSLFSILTTAEDLFHEANSRSKKTSRDDDAGPGRPFAELVQLFVIDLGFIITPGALLWISKTSTVNPLYTLCEQRLQLLWMLGLMLMAVVILLSAIKSFKKPLVSKAYIQAAARTASVIFLVLLLCTAVYYRVTEPLEQVGPCVRAPAEETFNYTRVTEHPIQLYENRQCGECSELLQQCGWSRTMGRQLSAVSNLYPVGDSKQCSWPRDRRNNLLPKCANKQEPQIMRQWEWPQSKCRSLQCKELFEHLEWYEANYAQHCEWPRIKQIQAYERKDRCPVGFPQCDWPRAKQIQAYEDQDRCPAQTLVQCEWPRVKQIQLYEQEERCPAKGEVLQQCDWPWLKQIQLFEAHGRCPLKNPQECDWPWVKQVQLYTGKESCQDACRCMS